MKKLTVLLLGLLILCPPSFGVGKIQGTIGAVSSLTVCGRTFVNTDNLIILNMQTQGGVGTGSNGFHTNPVTGVTAEYSVPVGKIFIAFGVSIQQTNASSVSTLPWALVYADDAGELDTALTNPVGLISGVSTGNLNDRVITPSNEGGSLTNKCQVISGSAPATKFIAGQSQVASTAIAFWTVYGYEVGI